MSPTPSLARVAGRLAAPLLALLVLPLPAAALDPVNKTLFGAKALQGYDPVAYFEQGEPVEGSKQWSTEWNGATWLFASAEHRDLFTADPERYAPRYGGYCAWAVSQGYTAGIDPEAWTIRDGKLYLNYSPEVQERWLGEVEEAIRRADENWPALLAGE